jgi:hypothetical protein
VAARASGATSSRRAIPVAPFGCSAGDVLDQERQKPAVLAYAGYPPPDLRPVREPSPAVGGAVHLETTLLEAARVGLEVVGGHAVVDQAPTGGQESPPTPNVVPGIIRVQKGHKLEVGAFLEGDEGVARQAVGVLATRRNREPEPLVVAHGPAQVADEDHQVVQTCQHVTPTRNLGEQRLTGRGIGAPVALPTFEGAAGQVDDAEP